MANGSNSLNDATAQTLNYALGNLGGGTRSWMLSATPIATPALTERAGRPVPSVPSAQASTPASGPRRRGRPRKHSLPEPPPNIATVQAPCEPPIEKQPSSTSASPHLANITGQERRPSFTVLPSPTPSLERVALPYVSDAGPASVLDFFSFDAAQTDGAVGDDAASAIHEMRQKRVSTDFSAQAPKRPQLGRDGHMRSATTTSASANLHHASIPRPQSTGPLRSLSNQSPFHYSPHAEQMRPQFVPSSNSPLYAQGGPVDSRNMFAQSPAAPSFNMPVQNIHHANMAAMWYTTGECLQMLNAFEQSRGTAGGSPQSDGGRLDVLRTAVAKEDWNYLMIHQIYCLHDVQPSALPQIILSQAAWPNALQLLRTVLDDNRKLSGEAQLFFANFPYSMHTISTTWPYRFNELLTKFSTFVFSSTRFAVFKTACQQRRYPPLPSELVDVLALESLVLQRVLFTSVLRTIWHAVPPGDRRSHYEKQAVKHFNQSQAEFSQRRMRSAEPGQSNTGQATYDNGWDDHWRTSFRQVIDACESFQGGQSNVAPNQSALSQQQQQQQQQVQQSSLFMQQIVSSRTNQMAPRPQPPAQPYPNQSHHPARPQVQPVPPSRQLQSQSRLNTALLPAPRVQLPQQRQPNPARFSLHQAHLRSPVPKARSMESKLYQYVEGFCKSPARLSTANRAIEKWSFRLSAGDIQTIAPTVLGPPGQAGYRMVDKNSKTLRLRCIKWTASNRPEDHVWAITDTSWIPYSCFKLNGVLLEQRKKVHHGKDIPIDITKHVKEGENVLEIMVTSDSRDKAFLDYLVAVEFLGITCEETMKSNCLGEKFESSEEVMAKLKTKLSSGSGEDDELAIVGGTQTINLFDPFNASKMCELPVRSRVCLHNDCFDLEIFLSTRRRKGDISDPDVWRCPICNADARPKYLIADGFLVEVKKVLEAKGQARTRAIVVHPDGSWEPKEEVRDPNGVSDDSPTPTARRASVAAEIIDISD